MEFDFLPKLPKSNLDDRRFSDLVEECILRIPRYCPEWTNHNPSDPGITLIEMFAWLNGSKYMLAHCKSCRVLYSQFRGIASTSNMPHAAYDT